MIATEEETARAREALIGAADLLRQALYDVNLHGDVLDGIKLTHQRDGSTYGEVNDGLRILLGVLFPDQDPYEILTVGCDWDPEVSFAVIVQYIIDQNEPEIAP